MTGTGKVIRTIGRVRTKCPFAKDTAIRSKRWFHVFKDLAVPLIMGSDLLDDTRTMSEFTYRLDDRPPSSSNFQIVNLIGSTRQAKRKLAASIDGREVFLEADSGCQLGDLMSAAYVRKQRYKIDRRSECRKRPRLADGTPAETIGRVTQNLTMRNGDSYPLTFDVLPSLINDVVLGEATLEEIKAFTVHQHSFVDVLAGERYLELGILSHLGKVNQFLARHLRFLCGGRKSKSRKSRIHHSRRSLPWPF